MAVIVVNQLPSPPNPAKFTTVPLPVWCVTVEYVEDLGLRGVPTCGARGSARRIVRVHGGYCDKVISWIAAGWGAKPPLPGWDTGSANEVLIRRRRALPAWGKAIDGSDICTVFGQYVYALQVSPGDYDSLTGASAPYQSNQSVTVYNLQPSDFSSAFVGPSTPPGGSGLTLVGY